MPTTEQIKAKVAAHSKDFFGFIAADLAIYLSWEDAKEVLNFKADYIEEVESGEAKWNQKPIPARDKIIEEMKSYMDFAIGKATGHRGLSASRSIDHYRAWLWLLEDEEGLVFLSDDNNYPQYGVPMLKWICDKYGFEHPDDEEFTNMAQGLPCGADYDCGCGR